MLSNEPCQILDWESNFFGHRIAQAVEHRVTPQQAQEILDWCGVHSINCLYFLADSDCVESILILEEEGFHFTDIRLSMELLIAERKTKIFNNLSERLQVRYSQEKDIQILKAIARSSYRGSRFYFDCYFPKLACDKLYETWVENSCLGYADVVLVAEYDCNPIGYISCHLTSNQSSGKIGLIGVKSEYRGHGVGRLLIEEALNWFTQHNVNQIRVITQGRNVVAQRLYQRCGFLTQSVQLWYHKWFSYNGV